MTSLASFGYYTKIESLNKKESDLISREEALAKDKENLKKDKDALAKEKDETAKLEADLKAKDEGLTNKENELKAKEEALNQKEIELKEKEEKIEKKLLANRPPKPSVSGGDMVAYLTFDDGPSANTERILDILAANNIKATFFVKGTIGFDSTYQRIANEGHKIGNHTYSHNYGGVYSSVDGFYNSLNQLNNYLSSLGIDKPDIIRFPGGSNNTVSYQYGGQGFMETLVNDVVSSGYDYFDWNVDSGDALKVTNDKSSIVNNVISGCSGKTTPVILFHDSSPKTTTVDALQEIIDYLKGQGYSFGVLQNGLNVSSKF